MPSPPVTRSIPLGSSQHPTRAYLPRLPLQEASVKTLLGHPVKDEARVQAMVVLPIRAWTNLLVQLRSVMDQVAVQTRVAAPAAAAVPIPAPFMSLALDHHWRCHLCLHL